MTPETSVGKLLKLSLEAKLDRGISEKTSLQMARGFADEPSNFPYWTQEIIGADGEFKTEEWEAFWAELEKTNLSE